MSQMLSFKVKIENNAEQNNSSKTVANRIVLTALNGFFRIERLLFITLILLAVFFFCCIFIVLLLQAYSIAQPDQNSQNASIYG